MSSYKRSPGELNREVKRLEDLRRESKEAAIREAEEMAKRPLSLEQKRAQVRRINKQAEEMRKQREQIRGGDTSGK